MHISLYDSQIKKCTNCLWEIILFRAGKYLSLMWFLYSSLWGICQSRELSVSISTLTNLKRLHGSFSNCLHITGTLQHVVVLVIYTFDSHYTPKCWTAYLSACVATPLG